MAIRTNRWHPDTCQCVVEFQWDDTVPDSQRTHNLHKVVSKCARHNSFDDAQIWAALNDENPRKNIMRQHIVSNITALAQTVTDPSSGITWQDFKANVTFNFYYDQSHVLHLVISPLTGQQRTAVQNLADSRLGAGKVIVD